MWKGWIKLCIILFPPLFGSTPQNKVKNEMKNSLETIPKFRNYLTEEKRNKFMSDDDGFIADLDDWEQNMRQEIREELAKIREILNSELMVIALKGNPLAKERWEGQIQVFNEFLGVKNRE